MTLSDLQDHSPIANLFKWDFSYSCTAVDNWNGMSYGISVTGELFITGPPTHSVGGQYCFARHASVTLHDAT